LAIETAEEGSIETAILASSKTKHMNVLKNLNQNRDPLRLVMACLLFLPATITMNAQSVTDQEAFQWHAGRDLGRTGREHDGIASRVGARSWRYLQ
jgi:hypothetical protein